ncbi:uncharacterized protein ACWYII_003842 [Salvelinus alpinus]
MPSHTTLFTPHPPTMPSHTTLFTPHPPTMPSHTTLFTPQPQLCPPTPLSSPHPSLPKATQSFFGYQRYQLGADSALFSQDYIDPSLDAGAAGDPYTSFTVGGDDLGQGDPVEGSSYQGINGEGGGRYQEY